MPYVFKMSIVIHLNLRESKQSCEKIFTMLIFDVSHMAEKIWRCSIFEADHAISFKNMITRQDVVFNLIGSRNEILQPKTA